VANLLSLGPDNKDFADKIYEDLKKAGIEVLYDDREVMAGEKFATSDLVGIPVRLLVSDKTEGKIEWKNRQDDKTELLDLEEVLSRLSHE
jgi:prolyl-tRNA synthetase